ncbi:putative sodium-coupled neutral amino acid transporter 11 isoform X1 [Patella vulgata]|uniref:putative sodium-coupled neutral amino acid transporter 11 isoform X1 n=1 Tax=Patella vulgata TaxID=6465 RepID=UPI00217F7925|nr:putative sodium-coupled neutral amino acid transporter 11 isoform X1 [Patella vulgata]
MADGLKPETVALLSPDTEDDDPQIAGVEMTTSDFSQFSDTSSIGDTRQLVEEKDDGRPRSGMYVTSFNFINSIIGSGVIGVPFALRQAGFGLGILLIIGVALITDYSIFLLIEGGRLSNTHSYQDMVLVAFGRPGFYILTVLQFLYPFIAMVSYNVIIGDTITKIALWFSGEGDSMVHSILGNRQFIIFLSTLLVTLPLSLYRNISRLGKWALLSILLIFFILVGITVRLATFAKDIPATPNAWQFGNYNVTQAIAILAFAYMCHHNTFLIYQSLDNPTPKRWHIVTHGSIMFAAVMCVILGVIGYVSFTGLTQGDLMENYCHNDTLMNIVRLAFSITIMLTYPVECFVTREVIENAVFPSNPPTPFWRHMTVTLIIVFLTAAVSMSTDCLGIVLEFNGVLAAAPLAYIIPSLCVMRLRQEALFSRGNIGPILTATFGILVAIVGSILAIINAASGEGCSHGREMPYCLAKNNQSVFMNGSFSTTTMTSPIV